MTCAAINDDAFRGPIIRAKDSPFRAQTRFESGNLTLIATVKIRGVPGACVDHGHLLREFTEARDE